MMIRRILLPLVVLLAGTCSAHGETGYNDETLESVIKEAYYGATSEVRRLSTTDALRAVDEAFLLDTRHFDATMARKLKRLLSDGVGEMFCFDRLDYFHSYQNAELVSQYAFVACWPEVFLPRQHRTLSLIPPSKLFCVDAYVSKTNAACVRVGQGFREIRDFRPLLPRVRRFECVRERQASVDRKLVADVESVRLQSLTQLDDESFDARESKYSDAISSAHANYLVTLRVRDPQAVPDGFSRFSFPVVYGQTALAPDDAWLFFRGMTLSVGFGTSNGVERVVCVDPVLPYSPYAKADVRVLDGEADRELYGWAMVSDNDESPIREVAVNYGDHTIVRYSAPSNLLSGVYGDIPDFSAQVDITVWTDGAEARPDYWRDAWFALNANADEPCRESRVRVLSAYDEFQDFDHGAFVFALRGLRLPVLRVQPPATMKDIADFFTVATRTFCPGRREFACVADESCAARTVRPLEMRDVPVLKGLEAVCAANGCGFDVEGTNVTIRAELADAELAPPDLETLLAELESEGFASVRGADYVAGWFHSSVEGAWNEDEAVLPRVSWAGCMPWTWIRPDGGETNRAWMVTGDGVAWRVPCVDESDRETSRPYFVRAHDRARLGRDVAKLIFALEENEAVNSESALIFAVQLASFGRQDEARRIVELLWRSPAAARRALEALRKNLATARAEHPTVEAWEAKTKRKLDERKRKKESDNDD